MPGTLTRPRQSRTYQMRWYDYAAFGMMWLLLTWAALYRV